VHRNLLASFAHLRDVAGKPPIVRNSSQLPTAFRDMLACMKVGQSTKADKTELWLEGSVICEKQETVDDSALRNEVQAELTREQGKDEGTREHESYVRSNGFLTSRRARACAGRGRWRRTDCPPAAPRR